MADMDTTSDSDGSERIVPARMVHVDAIHELITYYAERNRMLFRPLESLYETIRNFRVCVNGDEQVLGCCALEVFWRDLAEIKSLAVDELHQGKGIGSELIRSAIEEGRQLGLRKIFTLTREQSFFEKSGFKVVAKETLPHKVWTDCVRCPLQDNCDEIAMILELN